jgi:hypothetical protein
MWEDGLGLTFACLPQAGILELAPILCFEKEGYYAHL